MWLNCGLRNHLTVLITKYQIVQNFGRENFGKLNAIRQYFTPPNSRFTKVATYVSYCKFANIFPCQNTETINSPKFYRAKILRYTVITSIRKLELLLFQNCTQKCCLHKGDNHNTYVHCIIIHRVSIPFKLKSIPL